jgi:hypothetical protein
MISLLDHYLGKKGLYEIKACSNYAMVQKAYWKLRKGLLKKGL